MKRVKTHLMAGLAALSLLSPWPAVAEPVVVPVTPATMSAPVKLKLLSFNVWGLPAPIGRDLEPRMERIAEAIKAYDIVMLQETFDRSTERLPALSGFPYAYHHRNGGLYAQPCGLMTLSRFEIVKTDFLAFHETVMPDTLAIKGVLFTRIKHPELGFVDVYNTHYQSRGERDAVAVRIRAGNTALAKLLLKHNQYYPTILGGDFNLLPERDEYQDLMKRLPLIDTYAAARPQPLGDEKISHHTWPAWVPYSERENRIDYVFLLQSALWNYKVNASRIMFSQPVRDYLLSDHLGVASEIEISPSWRSTSGN